MSIHDDTDLVRILDFDGPLPARLEEVINNYVGELLAQAERSPAEILGPAMSEPVR